MSQADHWAVEVRVNGETILTIESNCLSGKSDLTETDFDTIRTAANNLLSFAGKPARHRVNQLLSERRF